MTQEPGNMQTNPDTSRPDSTGLNWAARWIDLKVNHLRSVNITHEGDFWMDPDNVRRYLEQTRGEYGRQVAEQLRTMDIRSDDRVLDIGAGSGALAVPLAKRGCRVTIVEQSPLMISACEEYRIQEGADPITYITRRWEEVAPEELPGFFDVIIASFSLTMTDIAGAIRSIQKVSSGRVFLFWFLTPPSWAGVMKDLWPALHNKPYYPTPLADCLWNVLYEMGIYANLEVMDPAPPRYFDSVDKAVSNLAGRLECKEEWQIEILRAYMRKKLVSAHDGLYLYNEGHRSAKIWWDNSRLDSHHEEHYH